MRKKVIIVLSGLLILACAVLLLVFKFGLLNCFKSINSDSGKESEAAHLKYFGYYHTDGFHGPDHFDSIGSLSNSNIAMISSNHDKQTYENYFRLCKKYRMKAFVSVYDNFFEWKPGAIGMAGLYPDWETRWKDFKDKIRDNMDDIIGFYFDEPYWNGVTENDFTMITKKIRQEYPDKRILVCATAKEIDNGNEANEVSSTYFDYITDATYDLYTSWDDYERKRLNDRLKSKLNAGQKIWFIAWGFSQGKYKSTGSLTQSLIKSYEMALKEPRCEGILVFSYASGDAGDWGAGLDRFFDENNELFDPKLKDIHIDIGRKIINGK